MNVGGGGGGCAVEAGGARPSRLRCLLCLCSNPLRLPGRLSRLAGDIEVRIGCIPAPRSDTLPVFDSSIGGSLSLSLSSDDDSGNSTGVLASVTISSRSSVDPRLRIKADRLGVDWDGLNGDGIAEGTFGFRPLLLLGVEESFASFVVALWVSSSVDCTASVAFSMEGIVVDGEVDFFSWRA